MLHGRELIESKHIPTAVCCIHGSFGHSCFAHTAWSNAAGASWPSNVAASESTVISDQVAADGTVSWAGTAVSSPSLAAAMARKSVIGAPRGKKYPQTNGWIFWRFRDTDGSMHNIDVFRQRFRGGSTGLQQPQASPRVQPCRGLAAQPTHLPRSCRSVRPAHP